MKADDHEHREETLKDSSQQTGKVIVRGAKGAKTPDLFHEVRIGADGAAQAVAAEPSPMVSESRLRAPAVEMPEAKDEAVPSLYPDHDPEFARPIFRKRIDGMEPPQKREVIRSNSGEVRPNVPQPKTTPRRIDLASALPPSPLPLNKLETGVLALDNRTGGLAPGTFNCITGGDRLGRSHLLAQIANRILANGHRVLALITPQDETQWTSGANLIVKSAARWDLEAIADAVEEAERADLVIIDPLHAVETPADQERIAAMDHAATQIALYTRRKRASVLAVAHLVERASGHTGVSLHPWMFRETSCLLDLSELILMVRTARSGSREILVYRRGYKNRIGGLPSFVVPWDI